MFPFYMRLGVFLRSFLPLVCMYRRQISFVGILPLPFLFLALTSYPPCTSLLMLS